MYPAYKLIRSVNRQYPNNGFINAVSVDEESYAGMIIPEDFKDIINECLQEIYKDVALEEIFSFPTVAGQNQYVLPDDCDLRDIVEVTRTGGTLKSLTIRRGRNEHLLAMGNLLLRGSDCCVGGNVRTFLSFLER